MDGAIDALVGAHELTSADRQRLRLKQAESARELSLATLIVASLVAVDLAIRTVGFPNGWLVAAWAALVFTAHLGALLPEGRSQPSNSSARGLVLSAALRGALWGAATLLITAVAPDLHAPVIVAVSIVACTIGVALINYPQAAVAFCGAFLLPAATYLVARGGASLAISDGLPLAVIPMVFALLALRQGQRFIERTRQAAASQDVARLVRLMFGESGRSRDRWLWGFDADGKINQSSEGFSPTTFLRPDQLLGLDFIKFLSCVTASNDLPMQQVRNAVLQQLPFSDVELRLFAGEAESYWRLSGEPIVGDDGSFQGFLGIVVDVSEQRSSSRSMSTLAHRDALTGLHNRAKFSEVLNMCVSRLERYGTPFALLYLDLDNFKLINDSRGHLAGDTVLQRVGERINANIRDTDIAARLGGDEFAILLTEDCDDEVCSTLAARLVREIREPIDVDGEHLAVGVSIGIAIAPLNGTRPDQLQRNADLALYRTKEDGGFGFRLFEHRMDSEARERRLLEMELRDAVQNGELVLYYQPLVSAEDRSTSGFEALVRWQHPVRGLVQPAEFIPVAENSSLIVEIGDWTIREACRAASEWPYHLTVAVNLSAKHFRLSNISQVVRDALEDSGLPARRLELEITESLMMTEIDTAAGKLRELQELGVTIVMDDFGTGYSSLGYLLKFPFDGIKIDRSFIAASSEDPTAKDILRVIASMGKTLSLGITAEGVETAEQAELLREMGCHLLQGFYFAKPLNPMDMSAYLLSSIAASMSAPSKANRASDDTRPKMTAS